MYMHDIIRTIKVYFILNYDNQNKKERSYAKKFRVHGKGKTKDWKEHTATKLQKDGEGATRYAAL
jgi:hypothetical protein